VFAASPGGLVVPRDAFGDLLPLVPTARRQFARTDSTSAFVRVYQAAKKPAQAATVTARILDASDRVVFEDSRSMSPDQFGSRQSADHRLALPLDRLEPGEYLCTIEAAQGQYTAKRGVRFTVR
jgi:hypothetical protein